MKWYPPKPGFDTGIQVYNCIVRKKVPLVLRRKNLATLYTCGPTVYDATHIGHASTYVKLDILRRILQRHFNIRVFSVMNITDIDDKIIRKGQESEKSWKEVARENEEAFWRDLKSLRVLDPHIKMRVTENIDEIIKFIRKLEEKDMAYQASDKSVNFNLRKYENYGKLQKISTEAGDNVDFALWKSAKVGEPSWESPWGPGRPGWHIECSAMASKILSANIDLHAGGIDLKFPHHENEEAQSCAYHGCDQWINYWLHTGHLRQHGDTEKMSKSLKNTVSVEELLADYSANQFRMLCLLSNYRNPMIFSRDAMEMSGNVLNKFLTFLSQAENISGGDRMLPDDSFLQKISETIEEIDSHLRDDFNTAGVVKSLQDLMGFINKDEFSSSDLGFVHLVKEVVEENLRNFGFDLPGDKEDSDSGADSVLLEKILDMRNEFRRGRDFRAADVIRSGLKEIGVEIKDHGEKSSWRKMG
ncbi:Cysteinyl-tRNA synthetase [Sergentomyia squamirostris]